MGHIKTTTEKQNMKTKQMTNAQIINQRKNQILKEIAKKYKLKEFN